MPRRRPRLPPDTRPDWRDPYMPVLVQHRIRGLIAIEPERLVHVCQVRLSMCTEPDYRSDPTYHMRKPK